MKKKKIKNKYKYLFENQPLYNFEYLLNENHFGSVKIDSLKLRLKYDLVKIIDEKIILPYIKYYPDLSHENSDIYDCFDDELNQPQPYIKILNGITYRFYPRAFVNGKTRTAEMYFVLQLSAKMAKKDYFNGITLTNIKQIVKDINAFNVIRLNLDDVLNGIVSDIDICINEYINIKSYENALKILQQSVLPSKKPLIHFINKIDKNVKNLGVDFNKREKANNVTPYCKIYHKGNELLSKSAEFYNAYLQPLRSFYLDNLVRYEFTIKNSKHKDYLKEKLSIKTDFKTLNDLLNMPEDELMTIAKSGIENYTEPKTKTKINTDLKPMDIVVSYYIEELVKCGFDIEKLHGYLYLLDDKPVQKSRTKKHVQGLIDNIISVDNNQKKRIKANDEANQFIRLISNI